MLEHREQGETRQHILNLLRRNGAMTAAELSTAIGIGPVGVRQHLALLERDNLVSVSGVRRGTGRPSHLYALTETAEALFPKRYDRLVLDVLAILKTTGGIEQVDQLFDARRRMLAEQLRPLLAGKSRAEQVAALANFLNEHGYMCDWAELEDGSFVLTEHNCPIDCVARAYDQACIQELHLYEDILDVPLVREETIATGGVCCRYRIH